MGHFIFHCVNRECLAKKGSALKKKKKIVALQLELSDNESESAELSEMEEGTDEENFISPATFESQDSEATNMKKKCFSKYRNIHSLQQFMIRRN